MRESDSLCELPLPTFVPRRYRPGDLGTWSGHIPFANDLIAALRPSLLVELGTHWGESYFSFCQSVLELGLGSLCYAIDTWSGDEHAGYYGEDVFEEVSRYNETNYGSFSYLLRTTFDEAASQFADESIDLLHIDGLHTYAAAGHDFRTWFPRVKPGGVVLLHDIAARHADFGVWTLWDEIRKEFPDTYAFRHSWGLGVLRKPGGRQDRPKLFEQLFADSQLVREHLQRHYVLYAAFLEQMLRVKEEARENGTAPAEELKPDQGPPSTTVQLYPFGADGYSESASISQPLELGETKEIVFDLPDGCRGPMRIDPADCSSFIEISRLAVIDAESEEILWKGESARELEGIKLAGCSVADLGDDRLALISSGTDPQLEFPALDIPEKPVRLALRIRVDKIGDAVAKAFEQLARDKETAAKRLQAAAKKAATEYEDLQRQLTASRAEQLLMAAELRTAMTERNDARRELKQAEEAICQARARYTAVDLEIEKLKTALTKEHNLVAVARDTLETERKALAAERALREGLLHSVSWKMTAPARAFMNSIRKLRG